MGPPAVSRVVATPAAIGAIVRLVAERGPVAFFQSGGCREGRLRLCFEGGDLVVDDRQPGGTNVRLGEVGGCGFVMDKRQYEVVKHTHRILDVGEGAPKRFSPPAGDVGHFLVRSRIFTPRELAALGIEAPAARAEPKEPADGARVP